MQKKKVYGRKVFKAGTLNGAGNRCPTCDEIGEPVVESALNVVVDGTSLTFRCTCCGEHWHLTAAVTACAQQRRPVGFWSGADQRKQNRS